MDMERKAVKQVILRFMACSDLHYKNDPACREKKRFEEGLRQLYAYADSQPYKAVDAVYIVGDFTDQGTMEQMTLVKESLDRGLRPGTEAVLCMASHEYGGPGGSRQCRTGSRQCRTGARRCRTGARGYTAGRSAGTGERCRCDRNHEAGVHMQPSLRPDRRPDR